MPFLALLVIFALVAWGLGRSTSETDKTWDTSKEWEAAREGTEGLDRLFVRAAEPLANVPALYERSVSPQYRALQQRLYAAGNPFGGSVEVFLAVQVVAVLVALALLALTASVRGDTLVTVIGILMSVSLAGMPWTKVRKYAKNRVEEINATLPPFADLLQMPLTAGMGVLPALSFTTERLPDGIVKDEMESMLALQKSRSVTDAEAFMLAGERLGTPEAKAFFTALLQAQTQGMSVAANLEKQAEALRDKAFEQRRAKILKLDSKISVIVAVHLIPMVLGVALIPMFLSLGSLGG